MNLRFGIVLLTTVIGLNAEAKTFQNSYVSFEVPDNWNCLQEGVAWTCTPSGVIESKEAVIVLAAKVAGPEDNINNFQTYLAQPKKITTKVGTPMPSQVMYSKPRQLANGQWVQAQHLGSEIQEYYTLYLATVKDQLAILVSFSSERNRYQVYNPIFDKAIKTLKITANKELLFPKSKPGGGSETIGINVPMPGSEEFLPPPASEKGSKWTIVFGGFAILAAAVIGYLYTMTRKRKKISHSKSGKPKSK
jgi:hypothetical protein